MIEHVSVPVSNVRKSKAFYTKALKPLGYEPWMAYADAVGFVEGRRRRRQGVIKHIGVRLS